MYGMLKEWEVDMLSPDLGVDPNQMPYDLRSGESILLHAVFCNKEEIVKVSNLNNEQVTFL